MIANEIERDGVEPRLLTGPTTIERTAGRQDTLEGVGEKVLRQRLVAGAACEKAEEWRRMLAVQPFEIRDSHQRAVRAAAIAVPLRSQRLRRLLLNARCACTTSGPLGSSMAAWRRAGRGSRPAAARTTARSYLKFQLAGSSEIAFLIAVSALEVIW